MNKIDCNLKGIPQMSNNELNAKSDICAFCGNMDEVDNKFVTCVTTPIVAEYKSAEKAKPIMQRYSVRFDLRIWDLFLCHTCILDNRERAFTRKLKSISDAIKGFAIGVVLVPFFYLLLLLIVTEVGKGAPFTSIINLIMSFLPLVFIFCSGGIIISVFLYFMNKLKHRKFILNSNISKEKDINKAFKEAGRRILESLEAEKDASSFKHFPLPKSPTEEDLLRMFPNKYVEYEGRIRRHILCVSNDRKNAVPKNWENLPISTKIGKN